MGRIAQNWHAEPNVDTFREFLAFLSWKYQGAPFGTGRSNFLSNDRNANAVARKLSNTAKSEVRRKLSDERCQWTCSKNTRGRGYEAARIEFLGVRAKKMFKPWLYFYHVFIGMHRRDEMLSPPPSTKPLCELSGMRGRVRVFMLCLL